MRCLASLLAFTGISALRKADDQLASLYGEDMREQLRDYILSRSASKEVPEKSSIVIIGNVNTGKSTLCQWLLARTDVCEVFKGAGQHTAKNEVFTGHWFGTPELGELEVMDTEGFLKTVNGDGDLWTYIHSNITAKWKEPGIDAIVYTSSTNCEGCAHNKGALNRVRNTFGTETWENLYRSLRPDTAWVCNETETKQDRCDTNFECCIGSGYAMSQTVMTDAKNFWSKDMIVVETTETQIDYDSDSTAKQEMEKTINDRPYAAPFLEADDTNQYKPMAKANDPKYNQDKRSDDWMVQRSHIFHLVEFRDWVLQKRANNSGKKFNISNSRPRLGPSIPDKNQEFSCGWPNDCVFNVTGTYLSDADQLQIFPTTHTCGEAFDGWNVPADQIPFPQLEVRPRLGDPADPDVKKRKQYSLINARDLGKAENTFKVCYCEYGSCTLPQRYHQEVGTLKLTTVQCEVPCASKATTPSCGTDESGKAVTVKAREAPVFTCETGYGLDRGAAPEKKTYSRTCSDKGVLGDGGYTCLAVECKVPPSAPNLAKLILGGDKSNYYYTNTVTFECDEGYTVDGEPEGVGGQRRIDVVCGADGKFAFKTGHGPAGETWSQYKGCRRWTTGEWAPCSDGCGKGTTTRTVSIEPEGLSGSLGKPPTSKECPSISLCPDCSSAPKVKNAYIKFQNDYPVMPTGGLQVTYDCDYDNRYTLTGETWKPGVPCTFAAQCLVVEGEGRCAMEWRNIRTFENITSMVMQDKVCKRWETTEWSECSSQCGSGYRSRKIQCSTGVDSDCLARDKPQGVELQRSCYVSKACNSNDREGNENLASPGSVPSLGMFMLLVAVCASLTR